jgi:adenosine deaminase
MRRQKIAVEINLRSNALLLGVSGDAHPLMDYLDAGVPVVLSTDDPGLMGTGLREQYRLAAGYNGITYLDLKQMVRNSIEYSFLEAEDRKKLAARLEQELAAFELSLAGAQRESR